jgi:hypothetical protein
MKHVCKTCAFAKWEMTKAGQINPKRVGHCLYVIPWPPLPIVLGKVNLPHPTGGIWSDLNEECPTWKWKEPLTKPKPEINWPEAVGEQAND